MNGGRNIQKWDDRLYEQSLRGWDNYGKRRLYLDLARNLEKWKIVAEFIYIEKSSGADAIAQFRLNMTKNDPLDIVEAVVIRTIFKEIYISNEALPGEWLDVIFGINFEYFKTRQI